MKIEKIFLNKKIRPYIIAEAGVNQRGQCNAKTY